MSRASWRGLAVLLALEDGQAVPVRPDAAGEDRVAVVEQVVRGDGGGGTRVAAAVGESALRCTTWRLHA